MTVFRDAEVCVLQNRSQNYKLHKIMKILQLQANHVYPRKIHFFMQGKTEQYVFKCITITSRSNPSQIKKIIYKKPY